MTRRYIQLSSEGNVAIIRLNRPKVLNALNRELMQELVTELERMDVDDTIRAIVITGTDQAFAAGADITEMAGESAVCRMGLYRRHFETYHCRSKRTCARRGMRVNDELRFSCGLGNGTVRPAGD